MSSAIGLHSSRGHCLLCLKNNVHNFLWRTEQRCVIHGQRPCCSSHAVRHEVVCFGIDHAIFLGNQKPGRLGSPRRFLNRLLNTFERDWPLDSCRYCDLFIRRMLCESISEAFIRQPDETIRIWGKLRRL